MTVVAERAVAAACAAAVLTGCAGGARTPPDFTPVALQAGRPAPAAQMLFDAEFNGRRLDRSVWYTCYPWARRGEGCSNNPGIELEWYQNANVTVRDGYARLVALRKSVRGGYPYTSGMISTGGTPGSQPSFAYLYGYAEARIALPEGKGMWPAFWIVPADRTWPPEIDFMEWQGVTPKVDIVTIHWGTAKHPQSDGTGVHTGVNLANGFHVYGCDWEPDAVTWYFDGKPIKTYADPSHIPNQPMYLILNLAIGGWERGQLHPRAKNFPATMLVDYVRVWPHKP
jgi:beta-glucanase (GH16 family)